MVLICFSGCRLCHNKQSKVYLPEPPFPHAEVSSAAVFPTREEQCYVSEKVDTEVIYLLSTEVTLQVCKKLEKGFCNEVWAAMNNLAVFGACIPFMWSLLVV